MLPAANWPENTKEEMKIVMNDRQTLEVFMTRRLSVAALLLVMAVVIGGSAVAQQAEIVVGEITIPSLRWGPQSVKMDVTNNADYHKIVSVITSIEFEGIYLDPAVQYRSNFFVEPGKTTTLAPRIVVPGNYGKADILVQVYDVIDTLDQLLSYQKMAEQPFTIRYALPDELLPYFQEGVSFPPMVSNSLDFNTEFSRLAVVLFNEGKSVQEIADMAQCDTNHVSFFLQELVGREYAHQTEEGIKITFPVITTGEAVEGRAFAEEIADDLTALVETNFPKHTQALKDLAAEGRLDDNADDFMHGGSVLYYTWPTVAGLFFWFDLAQDFINPPRKILSIYRGTDFCHARIPDYMYAVQGGPYYNGSVFYTLELAHNNMDIVFMDSVPDVGCVQGFEKYSKLMPGVQYGYEEGIEIEPFTLDTIVVNDALQRGLRTGIDELMDRVTTGLTAIAQKHGHDELTVGHRFWFWRLVTSRAMIKLDEKDIIKRRGNGRFRFEEMPGMIK